MLNLFRKVKTEDIVSIIKEALSVLPNDYAYLLSALNDGVIKGYRKNTCIDENYIEFYYNHEVYKRYINEKSDNFQIANIKLFCANTQAYESVTIFVVAGLVSGIILDFNKKSKFDVSKIDVSNIVKVFQENEDFDKLDDVLDEHDKSLIAKSHVQMVEIDNNVYFSIKLLDDGDFIAINLSKELFHITHNPFEVKEISGISIPQVLKER